MRRVTDRHMKLVRGDYVQAGIAVFPPILMSGDNHLEGATRPRRILNRRNHARGREKQGQHNEYRNHRPGEFNLRAPVDLSSAKTTMNIAATFSRTNIESPKIASAGVEAGAKMFVGLIGMPLLCSV